jgi:uncharacterized membrane protein
MNKTRFTVLAGIILAVTASRLIPHPGNFSPLASLALFGGASFASRRAAFVVPLLGLFLSDLVLGFYSIMPVVYGSFALIVCLGFWVRQRRSVSRIIGATLAGSLSFYVLTNLGVWAFGSFYPKTWLGLWDCYVAAIPYFRNTVASGLLYSALLFGGLWLAERRFATLREPSVAAA